MIYKYTDKRAKEFRKLFESIPVRHKAKKVIFAYGPNQFKFVLKNRTIEVNRYDEEIIVRKLDNKFV